MFRTKNRFTIYSQILIQLIREDLVNFKYVLINKFIDIALWTTTMLIIMGYVLQSFGLTPEYGLFMIAGVLVSSIQLDIYPQATALVVDYEGKRRINFYLTLPMPSWLIVMRRGLSNAITSSILCLPILPVAKIILWNTFSIGTVNFIHFLIIFLTVNLFFGFFSIWIASVVPNMQLLTRISRRIQTPLWFFGCFQFSWHTLYKIFPTLAILDLANPYTYAMEAMRVAIIGQEGYLSFWPCVGILLIGTIICAIGGHIILRKRLDFI